MDIRFVIDRLIKAASPERRLDAEIAQAIGWTRKTTTSTDASGMASVHATWYPPDSQTIARVPNYTTDMQAAYELIEKLCPGDNIGVAWVDGRGAAKNLKGTTIERVATPAIALCALALTEYSKR